MPVDLALAKDDLGCLCLELSLIGAGTTGGRRERHRGVVDSIAAAALPELDIVPAAAAFLIKCFLLSPTRERLSAPFRALELRCDISRSLSHLSAAHIANSTKGADKTDEILVTTQTHTPMLAPARSAGLPFLSKTKTHETSLQHQVTVPPDSPDSVLDLSGFYSSIRSPERTADSGHR